MALLTEASLIDTATGELPGMDVYGRYQADGVMAHQCRPPM